MDIKCSDISKEAIEWVKKNKNIIIEKFCSLKDHPPSQKPFTIFMAGSPGAGKTEFSKSLIPQLQQRDPECAIVRVDADEIRGLIPMYKGCNACELQPAASIGVEKIIDYVQKHNQNVIIDGTFASYSVSYNNVKRAILRNRDVGIFYLYQDPVLAWDFTQKREKIDGRNISKDVFIDAFFKAKENVNAIKDEFNEKIEINLIIKNFENGLEKTHFNIKNIDSYLKIDYNFKLLKDKLKNC